MFKNLTIIIILISNLFAHAQKDSLAGKSKINNLICIEGGYTTRHILVGNKGDIGLSYIYNHKHFLAKSKISFTPNSNFGLLTKFFINAGFTTKINKVISWHFLGGVGITFAEKNYDVPNENTYSYSSLSPILETGFLYNPVNLKHYLFGVNCSSYVETIHYEIRTGYYENERNIVFNPNIFILYKF